MSNSTSSPPGGSFKRASIKISNGINSFGSSANQQQSQDTTPVSNGADNNNSNPPVENRRKVTFGSSRKTFINTENSSDNLLTTPTPTPAPTTTTPTTDTSADINIDDLNLEPATRPRTNRSKTMVQSNFMGRPRVTFSAKPPTGQRDRLQIGGRIKFSEDEQLVDVSDPSSPKPEASFEKVSLDDKKNNDGDDDDDDDDDDDAPVKPIAWSTVLNRPKSQTGSGTGTGSGFGGFGGFKVGGTGSVPSGEDENEPTSRRGTFRKAIVIGTHIAEQQDDSVADPVDDGSSLSSLDLATVQRPKQQYHTIDPASIPQWKKNNEDVVQEYEQPAASNNSTGLFSNAFSSLLNRPTAKPASTQGRTKAEAEYLEYLQRSRESTFPDIESLNFIYQAGKDNLGRTIIVVIVSNLPVKQTDMERVLLYTISIMDPVVEGDYVLLYVHTNISNNNKPSFAWLKKVYTIFNRKYKKNLKGLYIVHPTSWVKFTLALFKPFISSKFWKKLTYIDDLADLFKFFGKDQLNLPSHIMMFKPAGRKAQPMFGAPLEEVINRPDNPGEIPVLFEKGIAYLERKGLLVEGIFRLSGANSQIKSLKQSFDSGEDVDLDDCEDIHTVAGLLKLYLRELPQPLFPFDTYSSFIEVARGDAPKDQKIESIKLLLSFLPPANKALSRHLFRFLDKVIQNAAINKMNAVNLSIVFAPNILRDQENNVMNVVQDAQYVNQVIQLLLENIKIVVA